MNDRRQVTSEWQWMADGSGRSVVCRRAMSTTRSYARVAAQKEAAQRFAEGRRRVVAVPRCSRLGMRVKTDLGSVIPVQQGELRSKQIGVAGGLTGRWLKRRRRKKDDAILQEVGSDGREGQAGGRTRGGGRGCECGREGVSGGVRPGGRVRVR